MEQTTPPGDPRCHICQNVRYIHHDTWTCDTCDETAWQGEMLARVGYQQGVPDEWLDEFDPVFLVTLERKSWRERMGIDLPHWLYSVAWGFWIIWFLVWETLAVLDKGENETLSGHVKSLMWQGNGQPSVVAFVLLPFLVWLGWHFYVEITTRFTT